MKLLDILVDMDDTIEHLLNAWVEYLNARHGTSVKVDDIYDYFKEDAESDSIEDAVKELGRDYTEEEIRLVRIKFICEQGN